MGWVPIRYRDFYDVPRAFVAEHEGAKYFFDCPFDEALDEYPDRYRVYRLALGANTEVQEASWEGLAKEGVYLRDVPVRTITFDPTRRASIDSAVLASF